MHSTDGIAICSARSAFRKAIVTTAGAPVKDWEVVLSIHQFSEANEDLYDCSIQARDSAIRAGLGKVRRRRSICGYHLP